MKKYYTPTCELTRLNAEDIVASSAEGIIAGGDDGTVTNIGYGELEDELSV